MRENNMRQALLIGMLLALITPHNLLAEEVIVFAVGEYPPFTSINKKYDGVASRIAKEAFALEGIKLVYEYFSWGRSYEMARQGNVAGTMPWFKSAERENDFFYSDEMMLQKQVFFHLKSFQFDWKSINDLKGIDIGSTQTYFYGQAFQNAEQAGDISVERVPNDILNFRKLLGGRIKIFPLTVEIGYAKLRDNFTEKEFNLITHHPKAVQYRATYALFSRKTPTKSQRLLTIFNRGLQRLKTSGQFDQYIDEFKRGNYNIKTD